MVTSTNQTAKHQTVGSWPEHISMNLLPTILVTKISLLQKDILNGTLLPLQPLYTLYIKLLN